MSLLSTADKVLARILLNRLVDSIAEETLSPNVAFAKEEAPQTVFNPETVTRKCKEQHKPLYMIFIALTKAFDSVNREEMWKILTNWAAHPNL